MFYYDVNILTKFLSSISAKAIVFTTGPKEANMYVIVESYNVNAQKTESRVSKSQNSDKDSKVYELMKTCL